MKKKKKPRKSGEKMKSHEGQGRKMKTAEKAVMKKEGIFIF